MICGGTLTSDPIGSDRAMPPFFDNAPQRRELRRSPVVYCQFCGRRVIVTPGGNWLWLQWHEDRRWTQYAHRYCPTPGTEKQRV